MDMPLHRSPGRKRGFRLLLALADGASRTFTPGGGPVFAELEPTGLYYAHPADSGGRLVFMPRQELFR